MSVIALVSRGEALREGAFGVEMRAAAQACHAKAASGSVRLYLADVDQTPLLGASGNETRRPRFEAALLVEGSPDPSGIAAALASLGGARVYRASGRVIKHPAQAPPSGEHTPGFTMFSPVYRARKVSHAEFDSHWLERHAPLALRHHPGMATYEQQVISEVCTPDAPDFDGVALLGFHTLADYRDRMFDSERGREIILADIRRFLDLRRSETVLMSEHRLAD